MIEKFQTSYSEMILPCESSFSKSLKINSIPEIKNCLRKNICDCPVCNLPEKEIEDEY